ncbi:MAG: hypothetical protein WA144_02500 [Candidatus Methanoperedens sp.]
MSLQKISLNIIIVGFMLILSIVNIVNATTLITDTDNVENLVEITDFIEKEISKSIDFDQFDSLSNNSIFLWSPDGSKLLILVKMFISTKNTSLDDVKSVRCGEFGVYERASTLFWIDANGTESTNIARTEESIRAAGKNTARWIESAWWSPDGDKIVFKVVNSCDEKSFNLYLSNRNGSILAKIQSLWSPSMQWSPDKSKIALVDGKDHSQIYIIDVENSTVRQLQLGISADMYSIIWSLDQNKIAFVGSKNGEIYTVNSDNSSVQQLTADMQGGKLSWKPDEEKLVFAANDGIYVIDIDDGNPTLIEKGNFELGSWSSDGKKIILTRNNEQRNFDKYYVLAFDRTTTKLTAVPDLGRYIEFVSWSPDGRKILFRGTDEKGNFGKLHVFDTEGIITKIIASDVKNVNYIAWSPNGDRIVFSSEDSRSVYTINPDGTDEITLVKSNYTFMERIYGLGLDNKIYSFTNDSIIQVNQDGTERLLLVKNLSTDTYSYNNIYLNPDGSRILFTVKNINDREHAYILKMKGYDETVSIYTPGLIREGDEVFIEVKSLSTPVKNATVFLNNKEIGVTNDSGFLHYNFKEAGNYRLNALKEGIKIATKFITVQERSTEQTISTTTVASTDKTPETETPGFSLIFALFALILISNRFKK